MLGEESVEVMVQGWVGDRPGTRDAAVMTELGTSETTLSSRARGDLVTERAEWWGGGSGLLPPG